ncbi:MAG: 30S ribosomal protein S12 methylthiotransferase RimO [Candidatus Omnitrophota bacterium]
MKTFAIVSLGCPRNLVDSEVIAGSLKAKGFISLPLEKGVDVAVINTCAFVESAREESVEAVIEAGDLKRRGKIGYLIICGCLGQLYKERLADELPEADLVIGTSDFPKIAGLLEGLGKRKERSIVSRRLDFLYDDSSPRLSLTPAHYAYVKISEGCSNRCSYCIIPNLRGDLRSRRVESVVAEVRNLARGGKMKEIELIGQDTTVFGTDRYGKAALPGLLRSLCALENGIRWIRLLYTHPAHYSEELIDVIAGEKKICKYLDLPIQHISDKMLRLMNRKSGRKDIERLIGSLRKRAPGIVLRTSVIVGFPQETDNDFRELLDFLKNVKFDRLGAFIYSRESSTAASRMKGQVSEDVKSRRYAEVMRLQQEISAAANRKYIGRTVDVLIDEKVALEDNKFIGRTEGDAPEIDGVVHVTAKGARTGNFCKVKIKDTLEYDLIGEKA